MNNIFSLFQGVFTFFKTISKNMYRKCAIITTGSVVIAVVAFTSNCYGGGGKNNVITAYAKEMQETYDEDDDIEEKMESMETFASTEEIAQSLQPLMVNRTSNILEDRRLEMENAVEADTEEMITVSADYISTIISVTEDDYNNLVRIVEAEATDLDIKAKILVANVVINRVFSKNFPDTVTEVIYQGNGEQFQPIRDGRFYDVELTESSYEAVDRALVGEDYSEGALFFATPKMSGEGSWHAEHLDRLFEYEGHVFFK